MTPPFFDWCVVHDLPTSPGESCQKCLVETRAAERDDDDVAFFFKQFGGSTPEAAGRTLDGRTWDQFPEVVHD